MTSAVTERAPSSPTMKNLIFKRGERFFSLQRWQDLLGHCFIQAEIFQQHFDVLPWNVAVKKPHEINPAQYSSGWLPCLLIVKTVRKNIAQDFRENSVESVIHLREWTQVTWVSPAFYLAPLDTFGHTVWNTSTSNCKASVTQGWEPVNNSLKTFGHKGSISITQPVG